MATTSVSSIPLGGADRGGELNLLLQQLQKSVLDDRKAIISSRTTSISTTKIDPEEDYHSEYDTYNDESERIDENDAGMDEAENLEDLGTSMLRGGFLKNTNNFLSSVSKGPLLRQTSSNLVANESHARKTVPTAMALSASQRSVKDETQKLFGPTTYIKQLETVFNDLEDISNAKEIEVSTPISSPARKVSLFGGKKGEKKRLIEKYKTQLRDVLGERTSLSERTRKAAHTGSVALGMLREEWLSLQAEMQKKTDTLEKANDLIKKKEHEKEDLRLQVLALKTQLEDIRRARPMVQETATGTSPNSQLTVAALSPKRNENQSSLVSSPAVEGKVATTVSESRLEQLETELDLAYGKLEALSFQQNTSQDRSALAFRQLQNELREVKEQLVTKAKKYAVLKERVRQLEEELEAAAGQSEAVKHQMELRTAKIEERLREAMREALENERTAKNALFKREQAEAEALRIQEQYDVLVGQFEAIRSQVELEKNEAHGIVQRYEKELEDVYGKLNAKDEYAGLLSGVKKDMDSEMTDLWVKLDEAEANRQKVEAAFIALGGKYRGAAARRLFNFCVIQCHRQRKEAFQLWKEYKADDDDE